MCKFVLFNSDASMIVSPRPPLLSQSKPRSVQFMYNSPFPNTILSATISIIANLSELNGFVVMATLTVDHFVYMYYEYYLCTNNSHNPLVNFLLLKYSEIIK